ncbi:hypothetical protein A6U95_28620 [Serratia sp. 14-2641]|nr:hypothetical protein A6U95_28620 [Serratia sp. 14-2641]
MSDRDINELRRRLSIQEAVIEHLVVRSELSLYLLSTVLPSSTLPADAIRCKIEQFTLESPAINKAVLEMEKHKIIKSL